MEHLFRYIVERDADLAIISSFEKYKSVRRLFLEGFRKLNSKIIKVLHSYMQQEEGYSVGESDIIFIMEDDNGRFAIFIEDKIKANAQPYQRERYDVRAEHLKVKEIFSTYRVFLCAPNFYINSESNNVYGYENKVSYEAITRLLPEGLEKSVLEAASNKKGCSVVDAGVTNFWKNMREFVDTYYKYRIVMKGKSTDKPSGSMWQDFATPIKGCVITLKVDSRKIDLEFSQMGHRKDELNKLLVDCEIQEPAIRTSKGTSASASIEIDIPEDYGLSFYVPFYGQEQRVAYWLEKVLYLLDITNTLVQNNITEFPLLEK